MPEKLSLLLPVWAGDRPDYLTAAFTSSVQEQTRPPDQVVPRVAQQVEVRAVHVDVPPLLVQERHRVPRLPERRREQP